MMENTRETIGCDLGDRQSELCVLSVDGVLTRPSPIKTTREGMRAFFEGRAPAHVVLEVGTHSRWVSELLTQLGHEVTVANPRRVKLISASHAKTDKKDAELLARLGRVDVSLLAPVKHRGAQAQADLKVAQSRDLLVASRTRLVNAIRGMVKSYGQRLPTCTAESFHRQARSAVPPELKSALDPLFDALGALEQNIDACDKKLVAIAKTYPEVKRVSQPNGVGLLTALVFVLTVEDEKRLPNSRMAGAFLGLTPRKDQSGDTDKQLHITKVGDPYVRRLLVCSANYILGPFGKDSDLRRWGLRLAERGGKNARRRAKVAVARKLAVLMHRLWVTGDVYEPLRNTNLRAQKATA